MTAKEKYKELYIKHVIEEKSSTTEEMDKLFQELLEKEFNDDPEKMTAFIDSLQEPEPAAISLEDLQAAMVELTNMILGG